MSQDTPALSDPHDPAAVAEHMVELAWNNNLAGALAAARACYEHDPARCHRTPRFMAALAAVLEDIGAPGAASARAMAHEHPECSERTFDNLDFTDAPIKPYR